MALEQTDGQGLCLSMSLVSYLSRELNEAGGAFQVCFSPRGPPYR